jgi:adenosine deaminase
VEHSHIIRLVRERKTAFEVCPTSNLQTGVVGQVDHHPVLDLHYLDIPITINTDDPAIHNCTLTDEYALAMQTFNVSMADLSKMIIRAAEVSFLPDGDKQQLIASLRRELGGSQYRGIYH